MISLPTGTGIPLYISTVAVQWNALSIANTIQSQALNNDAAVERLNSLQMQILHSTVQTQVNLFQLQQPQRNNNNNNNNNDLYALNQSWISVFNALKNFIFVALCDIETAVFAIGIISSYLLSSKLKEAILQDARFIGVFRLLYNSDSQFATVKKNEEREETCQSLFETFLNDIFSFGSPYNVAVYSTIQQFSKANASLFSSCVKLQMILKDFSLKLK
jgi:hypothetical protein